jgi:murein DD-endopeptidase MepM/ murein hydrolase activator NlpD
MVLSRFRKYCCLLLSSLWTIIFSYTMVSAFPGTINVSWDPVLVRPGGVVPVRLTAPVKLAKVEVDSVNGRFPLIEKNEGEYIALVGIASIFKGAAYHLDFNIYSRIDTDPYLFEADLMLPAKPIKKARKQALTVPKRMVHLSETSLTKVQQDSRSFWKTLMTRTPERYWRDSFRLPVKGRISTRFGVRRVFNGVPKRPHGGVDIAVPKGTPVPASNRGVVGMVEEFYLLGKTVVLDHGWGLYTVYAHLDSIDVSAGQILEQGQILGKVGATGRVTGPHLHFASFIRGAKVDPERLIKVTSDL